MRNLKKILALVLALVMSFSVMTVSSAAFKDEAKISANYADSVDVLSGIEVFRGDDKGNFNPTKNITRAEVAAIIYRITTGDVADENVKAYAELKLFNDVPAKEWYAGYVNYCASVGFIKGRGNGSFDPAGNVTGYDAMAMILRAIGYDKNGEFTGEGYTIRVAQVAEERGIADALAGVALNSAATRQVVAEILFQAITIPQVSYTLAFGYSIYANPMQGDTLTGADKNETLGYENFGLWYSGDLQHTAWGVPYMNGWFIDLDGDKVCTDAYEPVLTEVAFPVVYESKVAAAECDVAKAMGLTKDTAITTVTVNATPVVMNSFTNYANVKFDGTINLTDTRKMVGAQGRWTRVFQVGRAYEVVMMDEFLAQVTDVTELTYDRNGHVKAAATVTLNVYDRTWGDANAYNNSTIVWTSKTANFEYVKGQTLLMYHEAVVNGTIVADGVCEIIGAPATHVGYQSAITTRESHIVDGTEYPDAIQFHLDQARDDGYSPYVWYFDSENNLIAVTEYVADTEYDFGVITAIKWVDEFNTLSAGYALANIQYIDGTTGTVKIAAFNGVAVEGVEGKNAKYDNVEGTANDIYRVSSTTQYNKAEYTLNRLFAIAYDAAGRAYMYETTGPVYGQTVTGVASMQGSGYFAGKTTQFLVMTFDANGQPVFETFTGIDEIPSYNTAEMWLYADAQKVADYVFIIDPTLYNSAKAYTDIFFVYDSRDLTVSRNNYNGVLTVYGGMVNGEEAAVITLSDDVLADLYASAGKAVVLHHAKNGLVTEVSAVTENYKSAEDAHDGNDIVYAGSATDAYINDGILFTFVEGKLTGSYDLTDVNVITEYRNLEDTLTFAKKTGDAFEPAYLYVAYTYKVNTKAAVTIYITEEQGVTNSQLVANITYAKAEVEYLQAQLAAATDADEIAYLKAALVEAVAYLEWTVENAPTGAVVDTKAVNATIEAATKAVVAVEIEIAVEAVEVVYAVDADVKAVVVKAVKDAVEADEAVAELIALGAKVEVATKAEVMDGDVEFVVTITYGETKVEYTLTIKVTATEEKAAE